MSKSEAHTRFRLKAGAPDSQLSGGPVQPRSAAGHGLRAYGIVPVTVGHGLKKQSFELAEGNQ